MLVVTTDFVSGKTLEPLGLVNGCMVQAKHIGKDIKASFKSVIGGELRPYTEMMQEAQVAATARMKNEAAALNADAVVNVRFSIASGGTSEAMMVLASGTAVKFV